MASRRDQLHSYQFSVQRLVSALVMRDPYAEASPFRRVSGSAFGGIMITLLVISGFGIYGLFRPGGNQSWQHENTVVVEKESGAVYVYRRHLLYPAVNLTSALLIAGGNGTDKIVTVSRGSLTRTPRGNTLGIPNAPASLPPASDVVGAPWTLCSRPQRNAAQHIEYRTVLVVGRRPAGGRTLGGGSGLLVKDASSGVSYLIWDQRRYAIDKPEIVLPALSWRQKRQITVGSAWLSALPAGANIGPIPLSSRGSVSTALGDALVGEVYQVRVAGSSQYYVAEPARLAPITALQARILLGDPTNGAYAHADPTAVDLDAARASAARQEKSPPADDATAPPETVPDVVEPGGEAATCAAYGGAKGPPQVLYDATVPGPGNGSSTSASTAAGTVLADRVVVPPGHVAIVEAVPGPRAHDGGLNLVTDLGYRYPVPSRDVLSALGYPKAKVVTLPGSLVARIPAGPALDPVAARKPVQVGDR